MRTKRGERVFSSGLEGGCSVITLLVPLAFVVLFFFPAPSHPAELVEVTDVSFWSYPDYTRVVITLSEGAELIEKRLSNPDRLYFDIRQSRIKNEVKSVMPVANGMLKSIRAGQFNENTVRVVLDLGKIANYRVTSQDPEKIIVDVFGKVVFSSKRRIVIDAGHGGHDPGAIGPKGVCEKDVVLDVALKMKKILSQDPALEVFLTRDKDVFLKLDERTAIANSKNADLFVSVHANASPRRDARGIETYLLNWTNNEEALRVAARENQISLRKMKKMQKERDALDIELADLRRDHKRDESLKLAKYIQYAMVDGLQDDYEVEDHGVKQALFYVLFGAQMPSVLAEISFISNPLEERLLSRSDYRAEVAGSIAEGIRKYMAALPETQTVASIKKSVYSRD